MPYFRQFHHSDFITDVSSFYGRRRFLGYINSMIRTRAIYRKFSRSTARSISLFFSFLRSLVLHACFVSSASCYPYSIICYPFVQSTNSASFFHCRTPNYGVSCWSLRGLIFPGLKIFCRPPFFLHDRKPDRPVNLFLFRGKKENRATVVAFTIFVPLDF